MCCDCGENGETPCIKDNTVPSLKMRKVYRLFRKEVHSSEWKCRRSNNGSRDSQICMVTCSRIRSGYRVTTYTEHKCNSYYGASGSNFFSLADVRLAQATTMCGQVFIRSSGKAIADYMSKLILAQAESIERKTKHTNSNATKQREHIDPIIGGD